MSECSTENLQLFEQVHKLSIKKMVLTFTKTIYMGKIP